MFFRKKPLKRNHTRLSVDVPTAAVDVLTKTAEAQGSSLNDLMSRLLYDGARTFAPGLLERKGPRAGKEEAPVVRLVNMIMSIGLDAGATEIYLVPTISQLTVSILRPSLDNGPSKMITEFNTPNSPGGKPLIIPKHIQIPIYTRLKWMADLDILQCGAVQEGKIPIRHNARAFDIVVRFTHAEGADNETEEQVTLFVQPREATSDTVSEENISP